MEMHELPVSTQQAIKKALRRQLDEQVENGNLPEVMRLANISMKPKTISLDIVGLGATKLATVTMDQSTYTIRRLQLVEE